MSDDKQLSADQIIKKISGYSPNSMLASNYGHYVIHTDPENNEYHLIMPRFYMEFDSHISWDDVADMMDYLDTYLAEVPVEKGYAQIDGQWTEVDLPPDATFTVPGLSEYYAAKQQREEGTELDIGGERYEVQGDPISMPRFQIELIDGDGQRHRFSQRQLDAAMNKAYAAFKSTPIDQTQNRNDDEDDRIGGLAGDWRPPEGPKFTPN